MKNLIAAMSLIILSAASACNNKKTPNQHLDIVKREKISNLKVDSVGITDSIKISNSFKTSYSSKLLVFPTLKDKKLLDNIYFNNKNIVDFSKAGLQSYIEKEKTIYKSKIEKELKGKFSDGTGLLQVVLYFRNAFEIV